MSFKVLSFLFELRLLSDHFTIILKTSIHQV